MSNSGSEHNLVSSSAGCQQFGPCGTHAEKVSNPFHCNFQSGYSQCRTDMVQQITNMEDALKITKSVLKKLPANGNNHGAVQGNCNASCGGGIQQGAAVSQPLAVADVDSRQHAVERGRAACEAQFRNYNPPVGSKLNSTTTISLASDGTIHRAGLINGPIDTRDHQLSGVNDAGIISVETNTNKNSCYESNVSMMDVSAIPFNLRDRTNPLNLTKMSLSGKPKSKGLLVSRDQNDTIELGSNKQRPIEFYPIEFKDGNANKGYSTVSEDVNVDSDNSLDDSALFAGTRPKPGLELNLESFFDEPKETPTIAETTENKSAKVINLETEVNFDISEQQSQDSSPDSSQRSSRLSSLEPPDSSMDEIDVTAESDGGNDSIESYVSSKSWRNGGQITENDKNSTGDSRNTLGEDDPDSIGNKEECNYVKLVRTTCSGSTGDSVSSGDAGYQSKTSSNDEAEKQIGSLIASNSLINRGNFSCEVELSTVSLENVETDNQHMNASLPSGRVDLHTRNSFKSPLCPKISSPAENYLKSTPENTSMQSVHIATPYPYEDDDKLPGCMKRPNRGRAAHYVPYPLARN